MILDNISIKALPEYGIRDQKVISLGKEFEKHLKFLSRNIPGGCTIRAFLFGKPFITENYQLSIKIETYTTCKLFDQKRQ
jgi:hypothetical protein